ncbi:MAG: YihY/virulence factor BrkB family protein [Chlorobiota bacterium]
MKASRVWRSLWGSLRWLVWIGDTVGQRLAQQHLFLLAAGIAFNVALCFIPLGMVALWLFAGFVKPEVVEEAFNRVLVLPWMPSAQLQGLMESVVEQLEVLIQRRTAAGIFGIVGLLWTASALLQSLRTGLHAALRLPPKPQRALGLWSRLRDMLLTVILLLLSLLLSAVLIGWGMVIAWGAELLPPQWYAVVRGTWSAATSVLLEASLFWFAFRFVPKPAPPGRVIWRAVLVAIVMTELLRVGYGWYLENLAPWGWIYGAYAALVSLVVWAYAVAFVMLFAAVVASVIVEGR